MGQSNEEAHAAAIRSLMERHGLSAKEAAARYYGGDN